MRILHSKATADSILLVSACHNMNLFAVVTSTAVTVYRSTTLTVVATLPLCTGYVSEVIASSKELHCAQEATNQKMAHEEVRDGSSGAAVSISTESKCKEDAMPHITEGMAAWSPSGRLFTFALLYGVVLLLDVESGDLVRVLVPKPRPKPSVGKSSTDSSPSYAGPRHGRVDEEERSLNPPTESSQKGNSEVNSSSSGPSYGQDGKGGAQEGNSSCERRYHAATTAAASQNPAAATLTGGPAVIPLSTAVGPVAALSWVTVPYSEQGPRNLFACTNDIDAECLPLQPDLSSSLLDELETLLPQKASHTAGVDEHARRAVSILMILDVAGGLSFVMGGLHEVRFLTICIPHSLGNAVHVEKLITVPVRETQPRWSQPETNLQLKKDSVKELGSRSAGQTAYTAGDSFFFGLTSDSLRSLSKQLEQYRGKNCAEEAHETLERWAYRTTRYSYRAYFVARPTSTHDRDSAAASRILLELDLGFLLSKIVDSHTATICCIAEYCRMAQTCMQNQQQLWHRVLEDNTRKHLKFPLYSPLLRDALVERIVKLNQAELMVYFATIDKIELAKDVEKLSRMPQRVLKAVECWCYRTYDASLSLLNIFYNCNTPIGHLHTRSLEPQEGGLPSSIAGPSLSMRGLSAEMMSIIGELRRCAEEFLRCVQLGVGYEMDLIHYVLHRSSLLLTPSVGAALKDRQNGLSTVTMLNSIGKAVPMNFTTEPLSVERQPTLLRTLERIISGKSTVLKQYPTACELEEDILMWNRKLEGLIQCALRQGTGDGRDWNGQGVAHCVGGIAYDVACGARFVDIAEPCVLPSDALDPINVWESSDRYADEEKGPCKHAHLAVKVVEVPSYAVGETLETCGQLRCGHLLMSDHPLPRSSWFSLSTAPVLLQAPSAGPLQTPPVSLVPVWYGYLREDRHLLVYLPTSARAETSCSSPAVSQREGSSDVLMVAFSDDAGNFVVHETEEDSVRESDVGESSATQTNGQYMRVEVSGMPIDEVTMRATMSRAREFFVVASNNRFVVFDLYDD